MEINEDGKNITMPFREDMAKAVICGKKVCTSRSSKRGEKGDYFIVSHDGITVRCVLDGVVRMPLGIVAKYLYAMEGFEEPEHLKKVWAEIHTVRGYRDDEMTYVHFFSVGQ